MDQIVRHAGVLRLPFEDRRQDGRAFELVGVSLVGRRGRGVERQRIVDLRLVVVRIAPRQLFHRLGIGLGAGEMTELVVADINDGQRVDVIALALGLGADTLCFCDDGGALREVLCGRRDVRIPQEAQRDAPIGDAALGIGLQYVFECFLRRAVPKRMLIQHSAVE